MPNVTDRNLKDVELKTYIKLYERRYGRVPTDLERIEHITLVYGEYQRYLNAEPKAKEKGLNKLLPDLEAACYREIYENDGNNNVISVEKIATNFQIGENIWLRKRIETLLAAARTNLLHTQKFTRQELGRTQDFRVAGERLIKELHVMYERTTLTTNNEPTDTQKVENYAKLLQIWCKVFSKDLTSDNVVFTPAMLRTRFLPGPITWRTSTTVAQYLRVLNEVNLTLQNEEDAHLRAELERQARETAENLAAQLLTAAQAEAAEAAKAAERAEEIRRLAEQRPPGGG